MKDIEEYEDDDIDIETKYEMVKKASIRAFFIGVTIYIAMTCVKAWMQ